MACHGSFANPIFLLVQPPARLADILRPPKGGREPQGLGTSQQARCLVQKIDAGGGLDRSWKLTGAGADQVTCPMPNQQVSALKKAALSAALRPIFRCHLALLLSIRPFTLRGWQHDLKTSITRVSRGS